MPFKVRILVKVVDNADLEVIEDNLATFPEVLEVLSVESVS